MFKRSLLAVVLIGLVSGLQAQSNYETSLNLLRKKLEHAQTDFELAKGLVALSVMPAIAAFVGILIYNDKTIVSPTLVGSLLALSFEATLFSLFLLIVTVSKKRDLIEDVISCGLENDPRFQEYLK